METKKFQDPTRGRKTNVYGYVSPHSAEVVHMRKEKVTRTDLRNSGD